MKKDKKIKESIEDSNKLYIEDYNVFPIPIRTLEMPPEYSVVCNFFDLQTHHHHKTSDSKNYGTHSKNSYILDEPECVEFKEYILKEAKNYNDTLLGYDVDEWQFSQTWVSHKHPGQMHVAHTHPNSVISGVFFYGHSEEKTPSLTFHKPSVSYQQNTIDVLQIDGSDIPNTWTSFSFNFAPGSLIFFPSWFTHSVEENTTRKIRSSVAMNILPKEKLGSEGNLTQLLFNRVI